jgi:hypothetical protein
MTKKKTDRWKYCQPPYEIGKDGFRITDIEKNMDGWVDANIYHPIPYDLVLLQTEKKNKPGWWTGQHWEGLRLLAEDRVYYWKQEQFRQDANEKEIKR